MICFTEERKIGPMGHIVINLHDKVRVSVSFPPNNLMQVFMSTKDQYVSH